MCGYNNIRVCECKKLNVLQLLFYSKQTVSETANALLPATTLVSFSEKGDGFRTCK